MTKRDRAIAAIKAAGALGDQRTFLRLYVENRISFPVARQAFEEGRRFGQWIKERDEKAAAA